MAATVSATSTFTMQSPVLARIALLMAISMLVSVAAAADECSEHADAQQCYSHHEGCAWCVKDLATKQGVCVPKSEKESSQCVLWDEESCISKLNADECYHYRDSGRKCGWCGTTAQHGVCQMSDPVNATQPLNECSFKYFDTENCITQRNSETCFRWTDSGRHCGWCGTSFNTGKCVMQGVECTNAWDTQGCFKNPSADDCFKWKEAGHMCGWCGPTYSSGKCVMGLRSATVQSPSSSHCPVWDFDLCMLQHGEDKCQKWSLGTGNNHYCGWCPSTKRCMPVTKTPNTCKGFKAFLPLSPHIELIDPPVIGIADMEAGKAEISLIGRNLAVDMFDAHVTFHMEHEHDEAPMFCRQLVFENSGKVRCKVSFRHGSRIPPKVGVSITNFVGGSNTAELTVTESVMMAAVDGASEADLTSNPTSASTITALIIAVSTVVLAVLGALVILALCIQNRPSEAARASLQVQPNQYGAV